MTFQERLKINMDKAAAMFKLHEAKAELPEIEKAEESRKKKAEDAMKRRKDESGRLALAELTAVAANIIPVKRIANVSQKENVALKDNCGNGRLSGKFTRRSPKVSESKSRLVKPELDGSKHFDDEDFNEQTPPPPGVPPPPPGVPPPSPPPPPPPEGEPSPSPTPLVLDGICHSPKSAGY